MSKPRFALYVVVLALLVPFGGRAGTLTLTFESLSEGDILSSQFTPRGVEVFGSPAVWTAGSMLNEIDFPPRSGVNVLVDTGGPFSFHFADPSVVFVSGYVTYTTTLVFQIFGPGGVPLETKSSAGSLLLGSNELFEFTVPAGGIKSLLITGLPSGESFILDDLTFATFVIPEPQSFSLLGIGLLGLAFGGLALRRRRRHPGAKPRVAAGVVAFLPLVLLCPASLEAQGVRRINTLIAVPNLVYTGTPTPVTFVANVEPNIILIQDSVTLTRIDLTGRLLQVLGRMYDDGTHGDAIAGDYNYTLQVTVFEGAPATLRFRATAAYRGVIARVLSPTVDVSVAGASYSKPPDPAKVVTDTAGGQFPVNHLVLRVVDGTPFATVQGLASSVGGAIVGYSASPDIYQFEVPTTSIAQLEAAISSLISSPLVRDVVKNYLPSTTAPVDNDLVRLKAASPANAAAYDRIQAIEAFQALVDLDTPLAGVRVGVLDTGVLGTHGEFTGVTLVGTTTDTNGHGTSVAAIIGANNRTALGSYPAGHMNGLLAGVTSGANPAGSKLAYVLDSRQFGALADTLARINDLAAGGARVVNMSFAWTRAGVLSDACAAALRIGPVAPADFTVITNQLTARIQARNAILFVAAAGNYDIDRANSTPANIDQPNVITAGATNLTDGRAVWATNVGGISGCNSASSFGAGVDLAAPGVNVYAPTIPSGWRMFGGTSAAAPLVSGAAGLLVGINTGLDPARIADVLRKTGDPITPDQPLGGVRLNLKAAARFLAQPVDLFLLTDMTGSFADDIATFKSQAAGMVQRLIEERLNLYIGLGRFEDYPISPWGSASFGDRAYTRVQDLLPANEDTNGNKTPDVIEAINSLFTKYGEDGPESQLPALYQMATGAGQDVPPPGASTADIPPGQQANWRNNSLRLTILWTDAPFHQAGDSGPFPYPGPTFAQTIAALNTKSIKVIGILGGFDSGGWSHLTQVASGTTTLAPPGGVDCNGDGVPDLAEGQPLVCRISSTGSGIAQAVVNSVLALAKK